METIKDVYIFNNKKYVRIERGAEIAGTSVMTMRNLCIDKFRHDARTYVNLEDVEKYVEYRKMTNVEGRKKK